MPFYQAHVLTVGAILTDNGREFCGTETHPYELYLSLNEIEHRRTKIRSPQTNGFMSGSACTVLDEFFRIVFRTTFYESVETLQADFDAWRGHLQHPNDLIKAIAIWVVGRLKPSCYILKL